MINESMGPGLSEKRLYYAAFEFRKIHFDPAPDRCEPADLSGVPTKDFCIPRRRIELCAGNSLFGVQHFLKGIDGGGVPEVVVGFMGGAG